jgi:hypothetical protein
LYENLLVRRYFLSISLLLVFGRSNAQTAQKPLIAPYLKTGAYSKLHADILSTFGNQAALAGFTSFAAGVFSERKFMQQELTSFSASVALPVTSGVFGLQLHQSGYSEYAQMQAGLAYARKLSSKVDVGVQFNYYSMRINGYGNAAAVNVEAGAVFHFTEQLHGGVHVYNPVAARLGKTGEKLPSVYSAGFGYDASDHFFVSAKIEKPEDESLNVNAAIQYKLTDKLLARGGISSANSIVFFGVGTVLQNFRLDVTASIHPQLGITPGLLIIFNKVKK